MTIARHDQIAKALNDIACNPGETAQFLGMNAENSSVLRADGELADHIRDWNAGRDDARATLERMRGAILEGLREGQSAQLIFARLRTM